MLGRISAKNWEDFDIDSFFGVRKYGTENFKCDLCNHVRGNPVGTSSSGSNVLRSRGAEKKLANQGRNILLINVVVVSEK